MPKTLINCPMLVSGCADRDSYDTQLLYFTCSSLSRDDKRIFPAQRPSTVPRTYG